VNKYQDNDFLQLVELLRENKKLPYYAAEVRIDLFINFYIEKKLSSYFGEKVLFVAPEFPIRHKDTNKADRADVLCMFALSKRPIIVEIKTDCKSYQDNQFEKYTTNIPSWKCIVEGISEITGNKKTKTDYRVKYFYLMQRIVEKGLAYYNSDNSHDLVTRIEELIDTESKIVKGNRSRLINKLACNLVAEDLTKPMILYLAPESIAKKINTINTRKNDVVALGFNDIVLSKNPKMHSYNYFIKFLKEIA